MDKVPRLLFYLVGAASLFIILAGIRAYAWVINPILLAMLITITVLPVPGKLTKRGMPGWLSLVLTIGLVVLVLGLVILTVFFSVTQMSTSLSTYGVSTSPETTASSGSSSASSSPDDSPAESSTTEVVAVQVGPVLQSFIQSMLDLLVQFGIALFIFFFMISAAISLPPASRLGLDPNAAGLQRITGLTQGIRKYMSVLTVVNFLVGLGDAIFLLFLGVDFAWLWGILAWFMGYIPNIGFIIALIPPALLAYLQYGWDTALWVIVGYILINGGIQNFVQPRMMGTNLRISPVVVFVGLFLWGFFLGGLGAILAVPLTLLTLTVMENFEGTRTVAVLLRYTGEEKKEERKQAMEQVRGLWDRARQTVASKIPAPGKSADSHD
jgi:predicted PurR-regulated permease PerM